MGRQGGVAPSVPLCRGKSLLPSFLVSGGHATVKESIPRWTIERTEEEDALAACRIVPIAIAHTRLGQPP